MVLEGFEEFFVEISVAKAREQFHDEIADGIEGEGVKKLFNGGEDGVLVDEVLGDGGRGFSTEADEELVIGGGHYEGSRRSDGN